MVDDALPAGAWAGARTSPDGNRLLLFFTGAAEYVAGEPCTTRYVPVVEENETEVRVSIRSESPRPSDDLLACAAIGYSRSVVVELVSPFGGRALIASGVARGVFDGSSLAEPRSLSDGWQQASESPGLVPQGASVTWIRAWVPATSSTGDSSCELGPSGLSLLQGDPDAVGRSLPPTEQEVTGTHDINGVTATATFQSNRNLTRLWWTVGDRAYLLTSAPACDGDHPPSLEDMLIFARGLEL